MTLVTLEHVSAAGNRTEVAVRRPISAWAQMWRGVDYVMENRMDLENCRGGL